jgi:hypothetical protein
MLAAVALAALAALPAPATAAGAVQKAAAAAVQAVTACRQVADGAARLACYDAAAIELDKAQAPGGALDTALKATAAEQARGSDIGRKPARPPPPPKGQTFTVESAEIGRDGRLVVTLAGAGTWKQTGDDDAAASWPRPGTSAKLRKAVAGYFLMLQGQKAIRAERID